MGPSFFVFGAERSGTTLLAFMLSGQPSAVCLNDTFVFARLADAIIGTERKDQLRAAVTGASRSAVPALLHHGGLRAAYHGTRTHSLVRRVSESTSLAPEVVDRYVEGLRDQYRRENAWYDFLTRYQEPLERSVAKMTRPSTAGSLIEGVLSHIAETVVPDQEPAHLGEKTPIHTLLAPWILSLYPAARALVLVRDPITNIASINKRHRPIKRAITLYDRFAPSILALSEHDRVLALSYRSLLERPESVIEEAVRFLGLPDFDPSVPVRAFGKEKYTGTEVDPAREPDPDSVLDEQTREVIRKRHRRIYRLIEELETC